MSRGISLHVGLNHVDTSQYPDYIIPELAGCINDANAMKAIASATGFSSTQVFLDAQGTALAVKNKISQAARELVAGDIFFLTYSGHGGQIPDETGDEDDNMDETWIMYDRQLLDDELYSLWCEFAAGVRIFVLSDSCHSGTMVKYIISDYMKQDKQKSRSIGDGFNNTDVNKIAQLLKKRATTPARQSRMIPIVASLNNYVYKKELYRNIQQCVKKTRAADDIKASLIYISGCQDNQLSSDGDGNGAFTAELLSTWNNGNFSGNYKNFHERIIANMPADQTPNYMTLGKNISSFEAQKPFTVSGATSGGNSGGSSSDGRPHITGPSTWNANALAPTFAIDKGSNPKYYVELALDNKLFNYSQFGSQRKDNVNFYATWNDPSTNYALLTNDCFQIPVAVWNAFKNASRIYYRMGTAVDTTWNGLMTTINDSDYANAPYFDLIASGSDSGSNNTDNNNSGDGMDNSSDEEHISDSVGNGGANKAVDVRIVQDLLTRISDGDGGSSNISVDGQNGPKTMAAIRKFQRANELTESGLVRKDGGTATLLYIQSGVDEVQ